MSRFITKEKIKKVVEYCIPTFENWIDGLLTLFSMALAILTVSSVNDKLKTFAVFDSIVFWIVVGCIFFASAKILITFVKHFFRTRYKKTLLKECLSANTLLHMNAANDSKVRKILRSTYGTVAEWNPINYEKNVLIYDVHDQIRSVLIGLKELIIEITEGLSSDQVCVDLIYCYPSKEYNGHIPIHESNVQMNYRKEWTIITSGDTSQSSCKAHDYLLDRKSFYSYLDEHNYGSGLKNAYTVMGCLVGVAAVYTADRKLDFPVSAVWWVQIIKAVVGLALVLAVKEGLRAPLELLLPVYPARAVRYFLIVVTAGILWPISFRYLSRLGVKK